MDVVTSAALVTLVRQASVSLTMSIDYLNPAALGSVVEVEGKARPVLASQRPMQLFSLSLDFYSRSWGCFVALMKSRYRSQMAHVKFNVEEQRLDTVLRTLLWCRPVHGISTHSGKNISTSMNFAHACLHADAGLQ